MRFIVFGASLAATALLSFAASAEATKKTVAQSGRSTATITQGDKNGTTTTTRSTDGAQTITRKNGGNSATVTQSPGGGAPAHKDAERSGTLPTPRSPGRAKADAAANCEKPATAPAGARTKTTAGTGKATGRPGASAPTSTDCLKSDDAATAEGSRHRNETKTRDKNRTPIERDIETKFGFELKPSATFRNSFLKQVR